MKKTKTKPKTVRIIKSSYTGAGYVAVDWETFREIKTFISLPEALLWADKMGYQVI